MEFSRCARAGARPAIETAAPEDGLSKLNSVRNIEVDVLLGELGNRTAVAIYWPSAYRTLMLRYP